MNGKYLNLTRGGVPGFRAGELAELVPHPNSCAVQRSYRGSCVGSFALCGQTNGGILNTGDMSRQRAASNANSLSRDRININSVHSGHNPDLPHPQPKSQVEPGQPKDAAQANADRKSK
jgi:hypothetical protein